MSGVAQWGVRGPSGRVWLAPATDCAGNLIDQETFAREFATATGMPVVRRLPGGDWDEPHAHHYRLDDVSGSRVWRCGCGSVLMPQRTVTSAPWVEVA